MEKHITILGILLLICGVMSLLAALLFLVMGGVIPSIVFTVENSRHFNDDEAIAAIIGVALIIAGIVIAITSLPSIIGGIGLISHKSWGRIWGLIASALNIPSIPIGTIIGIYGLWVLLSDETAELLRKPQR